MASIQFTRTSYLSLRRAYAAAVANKTEVFTLEVDGVKHELLTSYAKHLLEFLKPTFGSKHEQL
jgi:hypothetical protein